MKKQRIPASLRQMVWIKYNEESFRSKCQVAWCNNIITPFTFEVGHNKPESKGGSTTIDNLMPICAACNRSMGNHYSITEYSETFAENRKPIKPIKPSKQNPKLNKKQKKGFLRCIIDKFKCFGSG